ncbi:MAG: prepilin-type N-terminal cleavage/methylation domain-containing protein [Pirellulales bacterium]
MTRTAPKLCASGGLLTGARISLQPTASSLRRRCSPLRRGLTLTEVLISMFVLLVGLMGVAAMIPAGRFEIQQGAQIDHATSVGRAAFRELKIRGYLDVTRWRDVTVTRPIWNPFPRRPFDFQAPGPREQTDRPAVAIDPLGLTAAVGSFGPAFPYNANALAPGIPYLYRIYPNEEIGNSANPIQAADLLFRNADDLTVVENTAARDNPPAQSMFIELAGNTVFRGGVDVDPTAGRLLKRGSVGDYSWLATIVSEPTLSALTTKVTVSVVVFYKRDLTQPDKSERLLEVTQYPGQGIGGGEVIVDVPLPGELVKPGQWMMLAGFMANPFAPDPGAPAPFQPPTIKHFRWYRVLAADTRDGTTQRVTLAGPDWLLVSPAQVPNTRAWLFSDVVAVYEKNMYLQTPN